MNFIYYYYVVLLITLTFAKDVYNNNGAMTFAIPIKYNFNTKAIVVSGFYGNNNEYEQIALDSIGEYSLYISNNIPEINGEENNNSIPIIDVNTTGILSTVNITISDNINESKDEGNNNEFNNFTINDCSIVIIPPNKVINTRVGLYQKYLSLSRSPFSIINQLLKNNQISSNIFSLNSTHLTLGSISNSMYFSEIYNHDYSWASSIKGIIIDNINSLQKNIINTIIIKKYKTFIQTTNNYSIYDTLEKNILAPIEFEDIFTKNLFANYINKKQCEKKDINEKESTYTCYVNEIKSMPDVNIILQNVLIKLTYNDLFDMDDETFGTRSNFRIVFVKGLTHWVFGFGLIKNNKIAFDNEHQMIGFSTESQAYRINTIFPHIIEGREMFPKYKWINSSVLICGIIFCLFVKNRIKKNIIY